MSITVEQLRFAIEEDETEYGEEFTQRVPSKYREGVVYDVRPANGEGWNGDSEITYEGGFVVIDGTVHELKVIDTTGGMDQGSNASVTWQVGDQYFRKSGYYASHYGYDWDGELEEVRPVQKVVTVFE